MYMSNKKTLKYRILLAGLENRNNWKSVLIFPALETQELNVSH